MRKIAIVFAIILLYGIKGIAQQTEQNHAERFEQLGNSLRSPNVYRTASGAPGHMYWQQKADHEIEVELNGGKKLLITTIHQIHSLIYGFSLIRMKGPKILIHLRLLKIR